MSIRRLKAGKCPNKCWKLCEAAPLFRTKSWECYTFLRLETPPHHHHPSPILNVTYVMCSPPLHFTKAGREEAREQGCSNPKSKKTGRKWFEHNKHVSCWVIEWSCEHTRQWQTESGLPALPSFKIGQVFSNHLWYSPCVVWVVALPTAPSGRSTVTSSPLTSVTWPTTHFPGWNISAMAVLQESPAPRRGESRGRSRKGEGRSCTV